MVISARISIPELRGVLLPCPFFFEEGGKERETEQEEDGLMLLRFTMPDVRLPHQVGKEECSMRVK